MKTKLLRLMILGIATSVSSYADSKKENTAKIRKPASSTEISDEEAKLILSDFKDDFVVTLKNK